MSQENVEIVRRLWETWERGDLTGWLELTSDDLVTRRVGLDNATYHGKEGFLEQAAEWNEGFAEWSVTAEEFIDSGDQVVVRNHQAAHGEASGVPVETDFWFVHMVRQGKIVRVDMFVNEREPSKPPGCGSSALDEKRRSIVWPDAVAAKQQLDYRDVGPQDQRTHGANRHHASHRRCRR